MSVEIRGIYTVRILFFTHVYGLFTARVALKGYAYILAVGIGSNENSL